MQRKTVTADYLTHKKTPNHDASSLVRVRDHHEPIVSRTLWEAAQAERERRSSASKPQTGRGSRYALSGKIKCALCGGVFTCRTRKRKGGVAYRTWCGGCACTGARVHLGEELIADGVRAIVGLVFESAGPGGISGLLDRICREAPDEDARREAARLEYKRIRLTDAFLSGEIDETAYRSLKTGVRNGWRVFVKETRPRSAGPPARHLKSLVSQSFSCPEGERTRIFTSASFPGSLFSGRTRWTSFYAATAGLERLF